MNYQSMKDEANKCLNCKNPSCITKCPSHNNIKEAIALIKNDEIEEASKIWFQTTSIGFVCGSLCDDSRCCISGCNNRKNPVNIKEICRTLSIINLNNSEFVSSINSNKHLINIAIIGGGIASLVLTNLLLRNTSINANITIYEKENKIGGVITNSLPSFRYDIKYYNDFVEKLKCNRLNIIYNTVVTKTLFNKLYDDFDYVVVATGASISKRVLEKEQTIDAITLLKEIKNNNYYITNHNIIVSGGGNIAYDVSRTLKKMNNNVSIVYRRDIPNSPASPKEIKEAINEGVVIHELHQAKEVITHNGKVTSLKTTITKLVNTNSERMDFIETEKEEVFDCDLVVEAIGSSASLDFISDKVSLNKYGYTDNIENGKVFVIGDAYYGAKNFSYANQSSYYAYHKILELILNNTK